MFLYCISPHEKIEGNFIKIGICENISLLKDRYKTYYGDSCRYHYVNVESKKCENKLHNELKKLGLHLENELFSYNKIYDFYFYVQMLKKFENVNNDNDYLNTSLINNNKLEESKVDLYTYEEKHMFDFIINMFEKLQSKKKFDIEWNYDIYKYYEKNEVIIPYYKKSEIETTWLYYLSFSIKTKQYYKTKNILKKNIQSMIYGNNPVIYKEYKIYFESNNIIIFIIDEINLEKFVLGECNIVINNKYIKNIENYVNKNINKTKEEIIKYIIYYNTSSYEFTKNIMKNILISDNNFKNRKKIKALYSVIYLHTIKENEDESLKNRLIYYNENDYERNIFKRINICLDIIKKCGFNGIFDLNKININKEYLFNHIISLNEKINMIFGVKVFKFDSTFRHINTILINTLYISIRRDKQSLFYIHGLEELDNEIITYKNNDIINKIKEEDENIKNMLNQF